MNKPLGKPLERTPKERIGMKVVISHSKTKREINGPFALCGSAADLRLIAERISDALESGFLYGWVDIYEKTEPLANTTPERWDDVRVQCTCSQSIQELIGGVVKAVRINPMCPVHGILRNEPR
jgi:hypothetical protein